MPRKVFSFPASSEPDRSPPMLEAGVGVPALELARELASEGSLDTVGVSVADGGSFGGVAIGGDVG